MSAAIQVIEKLYREAQTCKDPERLRQIARQQREYGQWVEARRTDNKAFEIEKRQGEEA